MADHEGGNGDDADMLSSDDVTGNYKEGDVVWLKNMPQQYKRAYNIAWTVSLAIVGASFTTLTT